MLRPKVHEDRRHHRVHLASFKTVVEFLYLVDCLTPYADAGLALSGAFALAAASDEAKDMPDEVGFFQAIRAALIKSTPAAQKSRLNPDVLVMESAEEVTGLSGRCA
jgi:hypothetical protein